MSDVFAPLLDLAQHIVVTSASYAGQEPQELALELQKDYEPVVVIVDPQEALRIEKEQLQGDQILVLTGSAYMIDQAINPDPYVKHLNATFGRRSTTV